MLMISKSGRNGTMKIMQRRLCLFALLAMCITVTIGCRKSEPRGDVFGSVHFDGKPVETGMVWFEPDEATFPPRSAPIENGKYHADGVAGLKPGVYRVRITAASVSEIGGEKAAKAILSQVVSIPLLPPEWNVQSKLSVDVKPGKNVFHFHGKKGEMPNVEIGTKE